MLELGLIKDIFADLKCELNKPQYFTVLTFVFLFFFLLPEISPCWGVWKKKILVYVTVWCSLYFSLCLCVCVYILSLFDAQNYKRLPWRALQSLQLSQPLSLVLFFFSFFELLLLKLSFSSQQGKRKSDRIRAVSIYTYFWQQCFPSLP